MKFSEKVSNGPVNRCLNFGGDPYPDPDPDRDTGKTYLGGGMHCPSASSFICHNKLGWSMFCDVCWFHVVLNAVSKT